MGIIDGGIINHQQLQFHANSTEITSIKLNGTETVIDGNNGG